MKISYNILICFLLSCLFIDVSNAETINRKSVVERHNVKITKNYPQSPSQVGNGKFAFGVDITGLQSLIPFNTMSDWGWHSLPLPKGMSPEDFQQTPIDTHGRQVLYDLPNSNQSALTHWLASNPHRANLGRIGFVLKMPNGRDAKEEDLRQKSQQIDLWTGIISSEFIFLNEKVSVQTVCHPEKDMIAVTVQSELLKDGQISVFFDFPYPDDIQTADYVGNYDNPSKHSSIRQNTSSTGVRISRVVDNLTYYVSVDWEGEAVFCRESESAHRFYLKPNNDSSLSFTCLFDQKKEKPVNLSASDVLAASKASWENYWMSGAAIDLSESKDSRWKELERRIVLSQYLMKVNESGLYPPQESGLVNNGWYGRFHFEMIWWHGVHYALWNRWELFNNYLGVYNKYLATSILRAEKQGYEGARWPKCTGNIDREWPDNTHATLIWQQVHPIYFAEMDYRLHPNQATLDKWKDIVIQTANFMADYAFFDTSKGSYVLGPPMMIVSENTNLRTTQDPTFELSYWRYGLRKATEWCERLSITPNPKWQEVHDKLSPLPVQDEFYVTHYEIQNMWTTYTYEHPALIGVYGMLPGDGVDKVIFDKTFDKVVSTWQFQHIWGWDFPMIAMAAARSGKQNIAIDMLMHSSDRFQFNQHGLCTGGPFPYFPANGGLLTTIAMMCGGWDGSTGECPGFPKNGDWVVKAEGFVPMQ